MTKLLHDPRLWLLVTIVLPALIGTIGLALTNSRPSKFPTGDDE